eukprot:m.8921 g.8921  ORF g.8921 m.8921 type:complete len:620 (+) comp6777_c0_seq2:212-2071(+)
MFYSEYVLAKKGPLGKVWLAAHWEKKLTRNQMTKSDIVEVCNSIIKPVAPLALRTSGHLLLGVVRIHDGKAKSLMHDCSDALVKIKLAFRPGNVDLPNDRKAAALNAITMTENGDALGIDIECGPMFEISDLNETQQNIGTIEETTMIESDFRVIDDDVPEMGGFGDDNMTAIPFMDDEHQPGSAVPQAHTDIEVGRDAGTATESFQLDMTNQGDDTTLLMDDTMPLPPDDGFPLASMNDDLLDGTIQNAQGGDNVQHQSELIDVGVDQNDSHNMTTASNVENISLLDTHDAVEEPMLELAEIPGDSSRTRKSGVANIAGARTMLSRRRKLTIDATISMPSDIIKKSLEPSGPNDITLQPYRESDNVHVYAFNRPAVSVRGMNRRLQDNSIEARQRKPASGPWRGALLDIFQRGLPGRTLSLAKPDTGTAIGDGAARDEAALAIEVGRDDRGNLDDSTYQPADLDQTDGQVPLPEDDDHLLPFAPADPALDDTTNGTNNQENGSFQHQTFGEGDVSNFEGSVSVLEGDETMVTASEFEQDHLTSRTAKMIGTLRTGFASTGNKPLSYNTMTQQKTRRTAAACLFELLVLKSKNYVDVKQESAYSDISVSPMPLLLGPSR